MSDLKEKIRNAQDIIKKIVECPEWDVKIEVRTMTGLKRADLAQKCLNKDNSFNQVKWQSGLIIACSYDPESGEPIFSEEDESWLLTEKSAAPIERLVTIASELNGLTKESSKEAEKK